MNGIKISGDIQKLLQKYGADVKRQIQQAADKAADAGASYLKAHSPEYHQTTYLTRTGKRVTHKLKAERPGTYAKGWQGDPLPDKEGDVGSVVHGKRRHTYALAHLLENGHETGDAVKAHIRHRNGKSFRVRAYTRRRRPHVQPADPKHHVQQAADYTVKVYEQELERRLKNL